MLDVDKGTYGTGHFCAYRIYLRSASSYKEEKKELIS